ncbi:B3 DNA binding domain containing protein [Trema orientale]|uniref:B3 DNA binding domain containing protein n=1 Tax=Trema orientale TaxID=63057 RepID=A0A2P5FXZ9_TREOI|nr:B3 DNA binding domain containing protein [Trema orientale]
MKDLSARQKLPLNFVTTYVKTQGYVALSVPNGRSWNVELSIALGSYSEAKLNNGWPEFASDNNLEVGDVCIFKLLDRPEVSFEVFIFRVGEYDCQLWSQGDNATSASKVKGDVRVKTELTELNRNQNQNQNLEVNP